MTDATPGVGDTLIVAESGGIYSVWKLNASHQWMPVRGNVGDIDTARKMARVRLDLNGSQVWFRKESEPDGEVRPYGADWPV